MNDDNKYWVNYWESHPEEEDDDLSQGFDFDNKEEALAKYREDAGVCIKYIEIDGPNINEIRKNPGYSLKQKRLDDAEWRKEMAMEAGMGLGIDAYNEMMGYDVDDDRNDE